MELFDSILWPRTRKRLQKELDSCPFAICVSFAIFRREFRDIAARGGSLCLPQLLSQLPSARLERVELETKATAARSFGEGHHSGRRVCSCGCVHAQVRAARAFVCARVAGVSAAQASLARSLSHTHEHTAHACVRALHVYSCCICLCHAHPHFRVCLVFLLDQLRG